VDRRRFLVTSLASALTAPVAVRGATLVSRALPDDGLARGLPEAL
jgi:hypothetical protein